MPVIQIQHRYDTAANWSSANPVLLAGEFGLDTTNGRVKLGDGTTAWNALAYQQNTILHGAGAPAGGLGVNGDVYFDDTNKGYYAKAAGSWGAIISLQGAQGIQGIPGTGVPVGGTTGQMLRKTSGVDYATGWAFPVPDGGSVNYVLKKNSATDQDFSWTVTPVDGVTLETSGGNARVKAASITNAHLATMPTLSIKGNNTGGTTAPLDLSGAQVKALLALVAGDITGLTFFATLANLSGHVTTTGSGVTTIANGVVTNAMQSNMAANTISANPTNAAAAPSDVAIAANQFLARSSTGDLSAKSVSDAAFALLSAADAAAETALLNAATASLKGLLLAAEKNRISTANMWFDVVADGGVDRTGVADGTTILQNAINTVGAAGGGIVWIPPNCNIKTSANINCASPFVTILGGSRVTSRITPTHATGNVFTVTAAAVNGFVRFENIRIQSPNDSLRTAGYGIEVVSGISNCSIQRVDILFQWSGIKASGQLCRIEDVGIRECGYNASNGCMILFDSFTDQYVKAVVFDNDPAKLDPGFAGIRITSLSSLLMSDCQVIHCGNGIDVVPAGANTIPSIYVLNCFFDQGTIGGNFVSGSGNILRSRFLGCWFSGNSVAGVVLNGASLNGLDFIGCEFYGAPSAQPVGIDAINAQEWSVRASRFAGNTVAIRTTAQAAHSFSVTDNIIGNVSLVGANGLGINVQAGTYARYQILDNRGLETNTTPGITDNGTTTYVTQKNVANNMGAGFLSGNLFTSVARGAVAIANAETLVAEVVAPTGSLRPGTFIEFETTGVMTNTTTAGSAIWRVRIGPTTLTGAVVGLATVATGTAARLANTAFSVQVQLLIINSTTAFATVNVVLGGVTSTAHTNVQQVTDGTIATNADQRVQLTCISGAATTTFTPQLTRISCERG